MKTRKSKARGKKASQARDLKPNKAAEVKGGRILRTLSEMRQVGAAGRSGL
jgi:hypothetical protein